MNITENARLYASLPLLSDEPRRAVIDLAALRHNYRTLRARAGGADCICVVKADAYGHGAAAVVRALLAEGCRFFAVSCLEEALSLRAVTAEADILVLGAVNRVHIPLLAKHQITATVYSEESAAELADEAARLDTTLRVHIKLDTGMNRLGFPANESAREETLAALTRVLSKRQLAVTGIYTHFARADEEDKTPTELQTARFLAITEALEKKGFALGTKHICNSAGTLRFAEKYGENAVRLGIALYGYLPDTTEADLRPVMRLESKIRHIHTLPEGECVGYGGTYAPDGERRIATVGIGYADGFLRAYTGATVTVHTIEGDFRARVVGRVCMDMCMLDVTDIPAARGDRVTLFGLAPCELEALSARADTIPYESLCSVSARVPRVYEE